jgi:hypothetical protein
LKECLTSKGNQLQAVLDVIKENDFHDALKAWETNEITVCVSKETVLKEMAAKIE